MGVSITLRDQRDWTNVTPKWPLMLLSPHECLLSTQAAIPNNLSTWPADRYRPNAVILNQMFQLQCAGDDQLLVDDRTLIFRLSLNK